MSDSSALTPPRRPDPPASPQVEAALGARVAALHDHPTPSAADPNVVLVTSEDGGVVVYPPSSKLVILAAERARLKA